MQENYDHPFKQPEDLGYGCKGNGTTVWDRNRQRNNDYLTVAHISEDYTVLTLYGHKMSQMAFNEIQRIILKHIRDANKEYQKWTFENIPVIVVHEIRPNQFKYEIDIWTPGMIDMRTHNKQDMEYGRVIKYEYVELLQNIEYGEGEARVWLRDWVNFVGDRFAVETECQPDHFRNFSRALDFFQRMIPLDYKP